MGVSDVTLLKRWASQRDAEAFAELVRRHSSMVYGACLRVLRNPVDAEDAAQDCFLNLVRLAQEHGAVPASLGGWLHAVAVRRALDRRRSEVRRHTREERTVPAASASTEPACDDTLEQVDAIIAELPDDLRHPLVSHFLEGRTHREIARELGLPRRTVTSRIARAVEEVRVRLRGSGVNVSASVLASLLAAESAHAAPASLAASLGKVAVIGETGGGPVTLSTLTGMGGLVVSAKKAAVLAVAIGLLVAGWFAREGGTASRASLGQEAVPSAAVSSRPLDETPAASDAPRATTPVRGRTEPAVAGSSAGGPVSSASAAAPVLPERSKEGEEIAEDDDTETAILEGLVLVGDRPLVNERVQMTYVDRSTPFSANTDAQGCYRFEGLRGGEVQVVTGFWDTTQQFRYVERRAILEPGLTTRVDFAFPAAGGLEGHVRLDGAVPNRCWMHVETQQASGAAEKYDVEADAQGFYRFNAISEGPVSVLAKVWSAQGVHRKRSASAVIAAGQVSRLDFDIDSSSGLLIEGNVTGLSEENRATILALPGAVEIPSSMSLVRYRQIEGGSVGSTAVPPPGGDFRIDGLEPGTYTVAAVAVTGSGADAMLDWQVASGVVEVQEGREARIDFDFGGGAPPPAPLRGTVTGVEPDEHVAVLALEGRVEVPSPLTEEALAALAERPAGVTAVADDGAFQMHRLEPGTYTLVTVAGNPGSSGLRATAVSVVDIIDGNSTDILVTLEPVSP